MTTKPSAATGQSVEELDQTTRRRSNASMPEGIQLFDDLLVLINHGTAALSGTRNDRGRGFLEMLLITRASASLWRARLNAVDGYPVQSLILCRSAFEDWVTLYYIEAHPEAAPRFLEGVVVEARANARGVRRPSPAAMLREVPEPLRARALETYHVLSWFVHPEGAGLAWMYDFDVDSANFHVSGYYSRQNLTTCLYFLVVIAQMLLEQVAQLQFRVLGTVDESWLRRGIELSESAGTFTRSVHEEIVSRKDVDASARKHIEEYRSGLEELARH